MNRKLFEMEIFSNIISVFTVTFDQFSATNKIILRPDFVNGFISQKYSAAQPFSTLIIIRNVS